MWMLKYFISSWSHAGNLASLSFLCSIRVARFSLHPRNKKNQQLIVKQLVNVLSSYLADAADVVSNWSGLISFNR